MKRTKHPAVSTPLWDALEEISRNPTPELRAAVGSVLGDPGGLAGVIHTLQVAERALSGPEPEAAIGYLACGVESIAKLQDALLTRLARQLATGRAA